jgi:cytochrome c oxidase subunit 1
MTQRTVGLQFLFTSLAFLVAGGLAALALRWRLAWPADEVPFLGHLDSAGYNALLVLHGSAMVFVVVFPLLVGAFGNLVLAPVTGEGKGASSLLGALSFWLFAASGVVLFGGFIADGSEGASAWTSYPPLARLASTGQRCWAASVLLATLSVWLSALAQAAGVLQRGRGVLSGETAIPELPLTAQAAVITALAVVLLAPVFAAALAVLLLDSVLGTSLLGAVLADGGAGPWLWRRFLAFSLHPVAAVAILTAAAMASDVLAVFSGERSSSGGSPLFGSRLLRRRAVIVSLVAFLVLELIAWGCDMGSSSAGHPARRAPLAALATQLTALPAGVLVLSWLRTLQGGRIRFTTPMLFALAFVVLFVIGGLAGVLLALHPELEGTYFVVSHLHYVLFGGSLFGVFAGLYASFPRLFGRLLDETLGRVHFIPTFVAFHCVFFPMLIAGAAGLPRRFAAHALEPGVAGDWAHLQPYNVFMTISALALALAQVPFLINLFWSLARGRKAGEDPWRTGALLGGGS